MSQKIRREKILNIITQQGFVTVRYLTSVLQYSTATVNRDLNAMQLEGLVKRSYGGVEAVERSHLPPLPQRQYYQKREKRRIAEVAAAQISGGDTVFLAGGTTIQYMIPFLRDKKGIKVITNSLHIAIELGTSEVEVICLGGRILEHPYVLSGEETIENALRYRPDKMFFSNAGVTAEGDICGYNLLYKILLKNSTQIWYLADRTKLVERSGEVLCDFSALTGVISDFDFSDETKEQFPTTSFVVVK